jgi:hypothetical protein
MRSSTTSRARKISGGLLIVLASSACSGGGKGGATAPEDEVQPELPIDVANYALTVSAPADSLSVGKYMQLQAVWTAKNVPNPFVDTNAVWTSSNPLVASVARRGLVTGNKLGAVTISAKSGNLTVSKFLVVSGVTYVQPAINPSRLLGDDFKSYTSTAAFMANVGVGRLYNDGVNQHLATIDTSVKYNGHQTLKYNQAGGTSATPELWPSLPGKQTNVWLHAVIRYSPGWTTKGVLTNTDNSYKILGMGWSNYYARAGFHLANTTAYQIFTNAVTTTGTTAMPAVFGMAGSPTTEWQDGAWYDYYMHYEVLTATSTRLRLWRGRAGQTPTLVATVNNSVSSGYAAPIVGNVMLGQNFNQTRAATQSQALWYGMWEVMDGASYPNPFKIPGA